MATSLTNTGVLFPGGDTQTSALPSNVIAMWSGSIGSIPSGWTLCDGLNNTPDLRDYFIVGVGLSYALGASGGSADSYLVSHVHPPGSTGANPSHTHSISNHTHTIPAPAITGVGGSHTHPNTPSVTSPNAPTHSHTGSFSTNVHSHNHTGSTGSGGSHSHGGSSTSTEAAPHVHRLATFRGLFNLIPGYDPSQLTFNPNIIAVDIGGDVSPSLQATNDGHTHSITYTPSGNHQHPGSVTAASGHVHPVSITMPTSGDHAHPVSFTMQPGGASGDHSHSVSLSSVPLTSTAAPNHVHTITINSNGSPAANGNLPPYYALAFIMKL